MENSIPNIFRIPKVSSEKIASTIIGILDASGSMYPYWSYAVKNWNKIHELTNSRVITFSTIAAERQMPLLEDIYQYNSKSTNICAGFQVLNDILKNSDVGDNITIIFISDGQDDFPQTLSSRISELSFPHGKKINFMSIGVGSGFPTFIAMNLREIYHNGEPSLPPVFLIEKPYCEEEWDSNFDELLSYTSHSVKCQVTPSVKVLPWLPEVEKIYENSWAMSYEDHIKVNNSVQVQKMATLTPKEIINISQGWLSELQITSLKKNVKDYATECLRILNFWINKFINCNDGTQKLTFNQRLLKKQENTTNHAIRVLLKEFKLIAEDVVLSQLSNIEAAKRLAIGTQTGKYHTAAMNLRGITVSDYIEYRDNFINIYNQTNLENNSDQEVSIISLQNQKDVFKEVDLLEGLRSSSNQYELIENFPVVGHALQIKRNDGAMINPYMIQVLNIAMHHKIVDTVSLQASNNELIMKIGNYEEEIINCVIPLFSKVDRDLMPLINTKLFNILMTFNVMGNADTCFENAYLGLLANTCFYLLNQTESEWRHNMLDLVSNTLSMTYSEKNFYKKYAQTLIETPRIAVITEHPDIETKCEDLSKSILVLFNLVHTKELTDADKIQEILFAIYAEAFGRNYDNEAPVQQFFQVQLPDGISYPDFADEQKNIIDSFPDVKSFYTKYELKRELTKRVKDIDLTKLGFEVSAKFLLEKCEFMNYYKINIKALNSIYKFFLPNRELPDISKLMCWTVHAQNYRNSYERNTTDINYNSEMILAKMRKQKEKEILNKNIIAKNCLEILTQHFENYMFETHQIVLPMTNEDLVAYCNEKKIDPNVFQFNQTSNLLKNSCMSMNCPYYMKPSSSVSQHLESSISKCHAFHKTVKLYPTLPAEEILEKVMKGDCLNLPDHMELESNSKNMELENNSENMEYESYSENMESESNSEEIEVESINELDNKKSKSIIPESVKRLMSEKKEMYIRLINQLQEFYKKF